MGRRDFIERVDILRHLSLRLLRLLNAALMAAPFACAWHFCYRGHLVSPFYFKGNMLVICLFFILYIMYGRTYSAFVVSYNKPAEMVGNQMLAVFVSDCFIYIVLWLLMKHLPAVWPLALALPVQFALATVWSYGVQMWYFRTFRTKRTLVVCGDRKDFDALVGNYRLDKKFKIVAVLSPGECLADMSVFRRIKAVFLTDVDVQERDAIIKHCMAHKIAIFLVPGIGDVLLGSAYRMHIFHVPILRLEGYRPHLEYSVLKRALDLAVSALLLLCFSPVMLATAGLIKLDGGPVFYRQRRLTKNGKVFDMIKFRSMRVDAEKDGVARLSSGDRDERVTRVGRVIRRLRIDELPQLLNVLKGEMSLVGPRPERPEIAAQYEEQLPEFRLRLQVKAGITGYAQIYGKYNTAPQDKLKMDLMYIAKAGIAQDLSILFATIKVVFVPESTEGIQEEQITALPPPILQKSSFVQRVDFVFRAEPFCSGLWGACRLAWGTLANRPCFFLRLPGRAPYGIASMLSASAGGAA